MGKGNSGKDKGQGKVRKVEGAVERSPDVGSLEVAEVGSAVVPFPVEDGICYDLDVDMKNPKWRNNLHSRVYKKAKRHFGCARRASLEWERIIADFVKAAANDNPRIF